MGGWKRMMMTMADGAFDLRGVVVRGGMED